MPGGFEGGNENLKRAKGRQSGYEGEKNGAGKRNVRRVKKKITRRIAKRKEITLKDKEGED